MCGIVGYVGEKSAVGIIVEGLKKLEYRGYDSAGIAILQDGALQVRRAAGKMKNLETILREVTLDPATIQRVQRVVLVACGTAYHAAMVTRSMIERLAGLPAEVDLGSELRYRDAIIGPETLVIAISQSGETADTIGSVKMAKQRGCPTLSITNVVGSALARETTGALYMHAGPEIGVASTKAFATMVVAVYLLGLWLGRARNAVTAEDVKKRIHDLVEIPRLIEKTLELDGQIMALARELAHARDFLYLGRGLQYPIALE